MSYSHIKLVRNFFARGFSESLFSLIYLFVQIIISEGLQLKYTVCHNLSYSPEVYPTPVAPNHEFPMINFSTVNPVASAVDNDVCTPVHVTRPFVSAPAPVFRYSP